MKAYVKNAMLLTLMVLSIPQLGLSQSKATKSTDCSKSCAMGVNVKEVKTAEIQFQKGKVYDFAFFSVKEGKAKQLNEQYFPQALEIGKEYGARKVAAIAVTEKTTGDMNPQMIGIFEWPDVATKERFFKDKRYLKIKPLRDDALSFLKVGMFEVAENTTIIFREDKDYEFFGAWLNPGTEYKLAKYFEVSGPIKQNYGRPAPVFKANFSAVNDPNSNYSPHMAGIVEWNKAEDAQVLFANEDFKTKAAPLMKEAIEKIDMLHGKFVF